MRPIILTLSVLVLLAACKKEQATEPEPAMVAPELLSPADSSIFSHFPRMTTFRWKAVNGAGRYFIQIEYFADGQWWSSPRMTVYSNEYTYEFVGAQPGRWRVWAVSIGSIEGPPSQWRYFFYTV